MSNWLFQREEHRRLTVPINGHPVTMTFEEAYKLMNNINSVFCLVEPENTPYGKLYEELQEEKRRHMQQAQMFYTMEHELRDKEKILSEQILALSEQFSEPNSLGSTNANKY